jgi:hypothetical protein
MNSSTNEIKVDNEAAYKFTKFKSAKCTIILHIPANIVETLTSFVFLNAMNMLPIVAHIPVKKTANNKIGMCPYADEKFLFTNNENTNGNKLTISVIKTKKTM